MSVGAGPVKRFYKSVAVKAVDDGFGVLLDDRPARTALGRPLIAPAEMLANAVAEEWAAQGEFLDRRFMKLTALLTAAVDGGEAAAAGWRDDVLKYLETDLLCYRAETPPALAECQAAAWDPYLQWLRRELGAALIATKGVAAVAQPDAAVAAVRGALDVQSPPVLLAIQKATAQTGSAVLGLALWKRAFTADEIFSASRVDEHFQQRQWGADAEAQAREAKMRREFLCAAEFLALLDDV